MCRQDGRCRSFALKISSSTSGHATPRLRPQPPAVVGLQRTRYMIPPHRRTHCRTAALRHSPPDGRAAALTAGLSRPVPVLPDRSMARRGPCDLC